MALTIATWNTHKGRDVRGRHRLEEQAAAVRALGADVVALQEVMGEPDHCGPLGEDWPHHAYGRARTRRGGLHHGNLLLARLPIAAWTSHDLSNHPLERRAALHAEIPWHHRRLHVVAVHLDLSGLGRMRQVTRLLALVAGLEPLVLLGDCNDWSGELDRRLRRLDFHEAHRAAHGRLARTFPAAAPFLPLDRIYVRGLRILDARRLDLPGSDHRGVMAVVE
jgi:endonuclease/exonuclease/phosphatase family metal-dependent hydrolase